jgi:MFS superfamily sulfate permease-like transporter
MYLSTPKVITSQLRGLFGMTYPGRGFLKIWYGFFTNITTVKLSDMGASLVTFTILFLIKVREISLIPLFIRHKQR